MVKKGKPQESMTRWPSRGSKPKKNIKRIRHLDFIAGPKMVRKHFMTTGLRLSLAKNNDKILMSTDLGFVLVKNGSKEFLCLTSQIRKINELRKFWGLCGTWNCPAGYGRAERIDLSETKVVRGILINKSEGE